MKFKLKPIFTAISLTFIAQAVVFVGLALIYRLIAKNFGPEGLGEYSLIKRAYTFLQPLLILGLEIGLPRYVSMSKNKKQRISYMKASSLAVAIFILIFLLITNLCKTHFTKIFFGNIKYTSLFLPFSVILIGTISHSLGYAYFRGRLLIKTFNILKIVNISLVPIGILIIFKHIAIEGVITMIGATIFTVTFIFFLFYFREFISIIREWQFWQELKEVLRYSLPRVPGNFALAGLFSLATILGAHFCSIQEVGYLSISQSLLRGISGIVAPLGIVLLPKVSNLIAKGKQETVKENINFLLSATFQCSIFVSIQLLIFTEVIIKYWLGTNFLNAVPVMRIIFLSIIFCAFYMVMARVLDAIKVKPLNTINISISLGIFLLIAGVLLFYKLFTPIISLGISCTCGFMCLGILTYSSIRKIYPESPKKDLTYLYIAIIVNILLGSIAILTKSFIASKLYYLIIFETFLGIIYLLILWLMKIDWIRRIPEIVKATG